MIDTFLLRLDTLFLVLFAGGALIGAVLMLVLRQPMRVALALVSTMVCLGAIYGLLGVHFIAAFQVLIYVGAVMVFMVYTIMLIDVRDQSFTHRYSRWIWPASVGFIVLLAIFVYGLLRVSDQSPVTATVSFGLQPFSVVFLNEYWLHFELISVLLVVAVVAAVAILQVGRRARG
jgi:NADH-quinone oxidoreductase subunit J